MTTPPVRTKPSRLCSRAVEFRAAQNQTQTDGRTLEGYAAVFDTPTEIDSWEGTFSEVVARGAFKRTINARTPVLQFDHGHDARTGSVPIGAIQALREDATGLYVSARLFDNPVVEPIRQAIEGGAIDGMSFRFRVVRDTWTDAAGNQVEGTELLDLLWQPGDRGPLTRTIQEVELFELGPVVFPAYEATTVGVRSLLAGLDNNERAAVVRDLANELRQPPGEPDQDTVTPPQADVTPQTEDEPEARSEEEGEPQEPATTGTSTTPTQSDPERNTTMSDDRLTVEERAARLSEIRARLAEIDNDHTGELPTDVQSEWDSLNAEHDEHERAIAATEARRERLRQFAERQATNGGGERATGTGLTEHRAPAVHRQANIYDLAEIRHQARSVDELPALYRDNARRAIEQADFPSVEDRQTAQTRVERLLLNVDDPDGQLARRMLVTGSPVYQRAFGKVLAKLNDGSLSSEERAALAVGTDANGGYAVPFQLDPTVILTSDGVINPLRRLARVEQIVGKEWQGVTSAGITVSRAAESAEAGDNGPTLAQPAVKPERVQGFVPLSIEIDQDWNALQSEVARMLAEAKDVEEATSFVTGDGTGTNAGGVVATLPSGSKVTVSTAAGGFKVPDTLDALTEALPPRFRARGQWLANISVYNKIGSLAAAGGYTLDPWSSLANAKPNGLVGYTKNEASTMTSDMSTAGSLYLLFGDFSQFLIVDRVGMSIELVPHLFGASGRPTGQRGIYAIWRNNSVVLVPGAFRVANAAA